jgi:RsiW-degrading membrane proteinase PrsW (M82 family)
MPPAPVVDLPPPVAPNGPYTPPEVRARTAPPPGPPVPIPLRMPDWVDLWPLATLCLLFGWIGGALMDTGRLYTTILPPSVGLLALVAVPFAGAAFLHYIRPRQVGLASLGASAIFTGGIGILILLMLMEMAQIAVENPMVFAGPLIVLRGIGWAYQATNSPDLLERWIGFVFGVGVCEESVKLIPLALLVVARIGQRMNVHTFLCYGFASGMGFGIGEALLCYAPWKGNLEVSMNIVRWFSVVPSHAIYTTISAAFLWKLNHVMARAPGFWAGLGVMVLAALTMAVVHGTYDTVCSYGTWPSLGMESLSFLILIWAVRWVTHGQSEPPHEEVDPWTEPLTRRQPLIAGTIAALMAVMLAVASGTEREEALNTMLHELDHRLWIYIKPGVDVTDNAEGTPLTIPLKANFRFALTDHGLEIVGTFTNTNRARPLNRLIIACGREQRHHVFRIGTLKGGQNTVIDAEAGWRFIPGEYVSVEAEGYEREKVNLPIPDR